MPCRAPPPPSAPSARTRRRRRRASTPSLRSSRRAAARGRRGCRRRGSAPGSRAARPSARAAARRSRRSAAARTGRPDAARRQRPSPPSASLVGRADGVLRPAEPWRSSARPGGRTRRQAADRRSIRSVRNATSSSPSPSRHSFAPYASPTAMRTTETGVDAAERDDAGNSASGAHDHLAADLLAQDRFGEPTSSALRRDRRRLQAEAVLLGSPARPRARPGSWSRAGSRARGRRGNSSPIRSRPAAAAGALPQATPARSRLLRARQSSADPSAADDTGAIRVTLSQWRARVAGARGRREGSVPGQAGNPIGDPAKIERSSRS